MADELDLENPEHCATLLRRALPDFEDTEARAVEPFIEALRESDNPAFSLVGCGHRRQTTQPQPQPQSQPQPQPQPQSQPQSGESGSPRSPTPSRPPRSAQPPSLTPSRPPRSEQPSSPTPSRPPRSEQPTTRGHVSQPPYTTSPHRPSPPSPSPSPTHDTWTERDRQRARGQHEIYSIAAHHRRREPIESAFVGHCQGVRVTLPASEPPSDAFIGTWLGTVEARDHLLFSAQELSERYRLGFGRSRHVGRVELITGARFHGRRFSPVSIYLAYDQADDPTPGFYALEGGSAQGQPKALYLARDLEATIHQQSGFSFTPFACKDNWYEGGMVMSADRRQPACVYLTVAQRQDGQFAYLNLSAQYTLEASPERVTHPFELQVEAAMRVMAIAEQIGCSLGKDRGGDLELVLGPLAESVLPWETRPKGKSDPIERARYCGCPKTSR